jgi:hypothetical protein
LGLKLIVVEDENALRKFSSKLEKRQQNCVHPGMHADGEAIFPPAPPASANRDGQRERVCAFRVYL